MRIFLSILFFPFISFSQNYVLNGSFEMFDTCPNTYSQIHRAIPWFQPALFATWTTSDFFHECANNSSPVNIPNNWVGFQYARTGNGYAGIFVFVNGGGGEYIEGTLSDTLESSKKYCTEFYVSLAEKESYGVTSNMGLFFSTDTVFDSTGVINSTLQIVGNPPNKFLTDTMNWMKIADIYYAIGGEKFITIGNFSDTSVGDTLAYYYVDDVSIYEIDENMPINLAGSDKTICKDSAVQIGSPAVNGFKYLWSPNAGLSSDTVAQPTANPAQTTTYILQITNDSVPYSCKPTTTDTVTVYVQPTTVNAAGLAGEDTTLCAESNNGTTLGKPAISGHEYTWQPTQDNIAQPMISPAQTTTYILTVTDTTMLCKPSGTDTVTVSVIVCDTIEPPLPEENIVFLPNIFSPNGDGYNDVFRVRGEYISEINFLIFNRWGEKVFETTDKAKGWDGTYKGKILNTGVFVYFLSVSYEGTTEELKLKGNVTLVR